MILIPALQLMGGKVVHLEDGDPDSPVVLGENPLEIARRFARQGALFFQLVDLDAVFGRGDNLEVVKQFADAMLPCQFGGGVRSAERVEQVLSSGADRVLIGTLFHTDPTAAKDLVSRFGVRVLAALDAEDGHVKTHGWSESGSALDEVLDEVVAAGVETIVYTDIRRAAAADAGPDLEALSTLAAKVACHDASLYVEAGARDQADVETLSGVAGVHGLLLGHRLYAGTLDLEHVLVAS